LDGTSCMSPRTPLRGRLGRHQLHVTPHPVAGPPYAAPVALSPRTSLRGHLTQNPPASTHPSQLTAHRFLYIPYK